MKKNRLDATQVKMWQIYISNLRSRKISEIADKEKVEYEQRVKRLKNSKKFKELQKKAANIRREIRALYKAVQKTKGLAMGNEWDEEAHCSVPTVNTSGDWQYDNKLRDKVEQLFNSAMKALAEKDAAKLEQIVKQMEEL